MYLGAWKIDDLLTFVITTARTDTGAAAAADSAPSYRVYEDETSTAILTGTMATLDAGNTTGFYSEQITLSAANGFEQGKSYSIYISATVNSVTGATHRTFQIGIEPNVTSIWAAIMEGSYTAKNFMKGFAAALLGKVSGMDASAPVFRDTGDSADRISATTDTDGNRTAVTLNL